MGVERQNGKAKRPDRREGHPKKSGRISKPSGGLCATVSVIDSAAPLSAAEEALVERHESAVAHLRAVKPPAFISEPTADGTPEIKRDPRVDKRLWKAQFAAATGSSEAHTQHELMLEAYMICRTAGQSPVTELSKILATMMEVGPRDPIEGRFATQMVSTHKVAMDLLAKGSREGQPIAVAEFYLRHAERLMRMFGAQVESLARYRGKAPTEQKVTVEHVHVYDGGQAVVGNIAPKDQGGGGS